MNLDDKLKELKEEVPEMNPSLEAKIYSKVDQKKARRNPIFNKLTLSIGSLVVSILIIVISVVSFNQYEGNQMRSSTHLLKAVKEPSMQYDTSDSYAQFSKELNQFASQLASLAVEQLGQEGNTVVSPVSIFSALALAAECSDGFTRSQLLDAMGMDYESLSLNYAKLYQEINTDDSYNSSKVKCKLTNSIWVDKNVSFKNSCLENLASKYFSYSHSMDLDKKNYVSRYITDFVSKQTNGFLKPEYSVSEETIFLLINTLYLKDTWLYTGRNIDLTESKYDFRNADGSTKRTKLMMGNYFNGKAVETEEYTQFYTSTYHGYSLHFIVPKDGYTVDQVMTPHTIAAIQEQGYQVYNEEMTEHYHTRTFFPEFSADSSLTLTSVLSRLGITNIFHPTDANFSNLTDNSIACNDVSHYARLKVNRKGIEGSAVTFFEGATAPGPGEIKNVYYDFIVDRSFGYVITNKNGVNLFSGIIHHI